MKKIIDDQKIAKLSDDTISKREPVQKLLQILLWFAAILAGSFLGAFLFTGMSNWHLLIPAGTGSILFVTTMLYNIKWNNQWFIEHAQAEFNNRKMQSDTLRAGWIAELYLEWQKEGKEGKEFPPALLAALSQSLFTNPNAELPPTHPFETLLATFNNAKEISVDKDGIRLKKD